jgi:hypothetical protein
MSEHNDGVPDEAKATFNSPLGEIEPNAVNVEVGRELVGNIKSALERLQQKVDSLPIGPMTMEIFKQVITHTKDRPGGVLVEHSADYVARLVPEVFALTGELDLTRRVDSQVLQVQEVSGSAEDVDLAFIREFNPDISDDELKQIDVDHIVWHEMGHGLQSAYMMAMPSEPSKMPKYFPAPTYRKLELDAVDAGVIEPVSDELKHSEYRIQSESFAEGFSQMLVLNDLIDRGIVSETDRASVTQRFADMYKGPNYRKIKALVGQTADPAEFVAMSKEHGADASYIGYGEPRDSETIRKILEITP